MLVSSFGLTDRGQVRPANEDALFLEDAHQFYAVADGLGGLPGGAETSQRIVDLLAQTMSRVDQAAERVDLAELIIGINTIVAREGLDAHPFTGTGSTLTVAQILGDQLLIGHVGDSAAYLLRDAKMEKLTIDHTMAQELIDLEGESARESMPPEYPHTLTRCIGQGDEFRVDQTRVALRPGDRLLLCTDGLNKVLTETQIRVQLTATAEPKVACQTLIQLANEHEGPDNITVIVVDFS